jgi:hypothetical protein
MVIRTNGTGGGALSDLKVDYGILEQTEKTLSTLYSEFENCQAQERVYDPEWGSGDVKNAMDGFTNNWNQHRTRLLGTIKSTGQLVSQTLQSFQQTDAKLAAEVSK